MKYQCNSCHSNCASCHNEGDVCPVCRKKGLEVGCETVSSLTTLSENISNDLRYYLCVSKLCQVAYYTKNDKIFLNQIKVPIWYKHQKDEYIVCYCRKITLNEIFEAVNKLDDVSKEGIIKYLNKDFIITDCIHNNPTGHSCDKLFINAISYALKQKEVN